MEKKVFHALEWDGDKLILGVLNIKVTVGGKPLGSSSLMSSDLKAFDGFATRMYSNYGHEMMGEQFSFNGFPMQYAIPLRIV